MDESKQVEEGDSNEKTFRPFDSHAQSTLITDLWSSKTLSFEENSKDEKKGVEDEKGQAEQRINGCKDAQLLYHSSV